MNATPSFDSRANEALALDPTTMPDEQAHGTLADGATWTVARYGTLVVLVETDADGAELRDDDIECRDETDAHREFVCARDAYREEQAEAGLVTVPDDHRCSQCDGDLRDPVQHCGDTGECVDLCECDDHSDAL